MKKANLPLLSCMLFGAATLVCVSARQTNVKIYQNLPERERWEARWREFDRQEAERKEACELYEQACRYWDGDYGVRDFAKAKMLFEQSARKGNSQAQQFLKKQDYLNAHRKNTSHKPTYTEDQKGVPFGLSFLVILFMVFILLYRWFNYFRHDWQDGWSFFRYELCAGEDGVSKQDIKTEIQQIRGRGMRATAITKLGAAYAQGVGVRQNYDRALFWFRLAAQKEYPEAHYNIGLMFEKGLGVRKNLLDAIFWYERASANYFFPAIESLKNLQRQRLRK